MNDQRLKSERFPRSSAYSPDWLLAGVSGGAHPLWLAEWLCEELPLRPGMRVLDLGCGRALSSVFLHREFAVQVWAADLWFDSAENQQRVRDAGVADGVFPVHADARALPFEIEFFDAIVAIDSFSYFGTDDLYLNYLARFLRPGGMIGIAGAGLTQEMREVIPEHLRSWWNADLCSLHSASWWQEHWNRTGIVEVGLADTLAQGWRLWLEWMRAIAPDNLPEIEALEADCGAWLGYVRIVGRRREDAQLSEPIIAVPTQYLKQPLLRD
jgi:cyclopropane fatty-acyl-phospholipid synthase-like methyltransferase